MDALIYSWQHGSGQSSCITTGADVGPDGGGQGKLGFELGVKFGTLSVLALHTPPNVGDGELPFSRLLDPRWAEVCLAHLREAEDYVGRRSKLGKKGGGDDLESPKAKGKAKAKAAASGSAE